MYPKNMKGNKQKHKCPECGNTITTEEPAFYKDYYLVICDCGHAFESHKTCYICDKTIDASKKINVCKECVTECPECLDEEDIEEAKLLKWL
ncbi:MAG: hypothetical protein GXX10_01720 [Clostridiaceae bacterium]|nr:hypothetical protein [Clostridiaceae bacterium]